MRRVEITGGGSGILARQERLLGSATSSWREWSAQASPELLSYFEAGVLGCLKSVRRCYPTTCKPDTGMYKLMKHECRLSLDQLADDVQEEHGAHD